MGNETVGTIFNAIFCIGEIATALFTQDIQGAVAEQAAKMLWIFAAMAGEIGAVFILQKFMIVHNKAPFPVLLLA